MKQKYLDKIEFPKICEILSTYCKAAKEELAKEYKNTKDKITNEFKQKKNLYKR